MRPPPVVTAKIRARGARLLGALRRAGKRWGAARPAELISKFRQASLDLVFPGTCVGCGDELFGEATADRAAPLCIVCRDELELFGGVLCPRCGAPLARGTAANAVSCIRCRGEKFWFDAAIAAGEYTGRLRELVLRMKPASGDRLSLMLGEVLWERCGAQMVNMRLDVVVPVPMHWRRRLAHGTNSAAVLAEVLAGRLRLPLATGLLRRRRHTPPQFSLTPAQRRTNVRRAFSVTAGYYLRKARVLLVDDILTTGATCSEAAKALKEGGAERVTAVVVARAVSH